MFINEDDIYKSFCDTVTDVILLGIDETCDSEVEMRNSIAEIRGAGELVNELLKDKKVKDE